MLEYLHFYMRNAAILSKKLCVAHIMQETLRYHARRTRYYARNAAILCKKLCDIMGEIMRYYARHSELLLRNCTRCCSLRNSFCTSNGAPRRLNLPRPTKTAQNRERGERDLLEGEAESTYTPSRQIWRWVR